MLLQEQPDRVGNLELVDRHNRQEDRAGSPEAVPDKADNPLVGLDRADNLEAGELLLHKAEQQVQAAGQARTVGPEAAQPVTFESLPVIRQFAADRQVFADS